MGFMFYAFDDVMTVKYLKSSNVLKNKNNF